MNNHLDWCSTCGAALFLENRTIHYDYHREQRDRLRELEARVEGLERATGNERDWRQEEAERG